MQRIQEKLDTEFLVVSSAIPYEEIVLKLNEIDKVSILINLNDELKLKPFDWQSVEDINAQIQNLI